MSPASQGATFSVSQLSLPEPFPFCSSFPILSKVQTFPLPHLSWLVACTRRGAIAGTQGSLALGPHVVSLGGPPPGALQSGGGAVVPAAPRPTRSALLLPLQPLAAVGAVGALGALGAFGPGDLVAALPCLPRLAQRRIHQSGKHTMLLQLVDGFPGQLEVFHKLERLRAFDQDWSVKCFPELAGIN